MAKKIRLTISKTLLWTVLLFGAACGPVHEDNSYDRSLASTSDSAPDTTAPDPNDDVLDTVGLANETYQDLYTDIFSMTCTRCHGDNPDLQDEPPRGLNFDDFTTVSQRLNLAVPEDSLLHSATDPNGILQMPRGGLTPLTTMERARVLAWIQNGAPES